MFNAIPPEIRQRMEEMESMDRQDREDGTPKLARLRQVPPETGRFIALMACVAPPGPMVEIGTSGGYSALWLALACRHRGGHLTTYEVLPEKSAIAEETVAVTGVGDVVTLRQRDGLLALDDYETLGFVFLDSDKSRTMQYLDLIVPKLVPGGLFLMDNAISHQAMLEDALAKVETLTSIDSMVVPVGKGVLLCRKQGVST